MERGGGEGEGEREKKRGFGFPGVLGSSTGYAEHAIRYSSAHLEVHTPSRS